jgi:hypothetical protein
MTTRAFRGGGQRLRGIAGAASLALAMGCAPPDEPAGDLTDDPAAPASQLEGIAQPLVGSTVSRSRPEIGVFTNDDRGLMCSATIVDRRYLLTAAHCLRYVSGPVAGSYAFMDGFKVAATIPVDRGYALGTVKGNKDIALVHLTMEVPPSMATPASIAAAWPKKGTLGTYFGFGCDARGTKSAIGIKQFVEFTVGSKTKVLCEGDSGGPVVVGGAFGGGPVFAVNSGFDGSGVDQVSDAVAYAPMMLTAARAAGGSNVTNIAIGDFAGWAGQPNVKAVTGDFNGDGNGDIALAGGVGWNTVPVAFGDGAGGFTVTNLKNPQFAGWAAAAPLMVAGDFDGDGKDDLAALGAAGWTSQPIAFSHGDGQFSDTNEAVGPWAGWAHTSGAKAVAGDFNRDGFVDIALVGGSGWRTIPVAFSDGEGTFTVTNFTHPTFAAFAAQSGVRAVAGDFAGDGTTGIALTGGSGWTTIPVAFSNRDGTFNVTNRPVPLFPGWAKGVKTVAGDFNGDGVADIAATGGPGWRTVAFAFSNRDGTFEPGNLPMADVPAWAADARFLLAGKMNRDNRHDLVLTGGKAWKTQPVVFVAP